MLNENLYGKLHPHGGTTRNSVIELTEDLQINEPKENENMRVTGK